MPYARSAMIPAVLLSLALATCCSRTPKQRDLYWRGEMWDGMNRMVFALQDLGWNIENVDTDNGVILARRSSGRDGRARDRTESGAEAAGPTGSPEGTYRIKVQFHESPEQPITIGAADPLDEGASSEDLRKMIRDVVRRFIWYGGDSLEVTEK